MNNQRDIAEDDIMPRKEDAATPDPLEQAQKDAAKERLEEGGYNG